MATKRAPPMPDESERSDATEFIVGLAATRSRMDTDAVEDDLMNAKANAKASAISALLSKSDKTKKVPPMPDKTNKARPMPDKTNKAPPMPDESERSDATEFIVGIAAARSRMDTDAVEDDLMNAKATAISALLSKGEKVKDPAAISALLSKSDKVKDPTTITVLLSKLDEATDPNKKSEKGNAAIGSINPRKGNAGNRQVGVAKGEKERAATGSTNPAGEGNMGLHQVEEVERALLAKTVMRTEELHRGQSVVPAMRASFHAARSLKEIRESIRESTGSSHHLRQQQDYDETSTAATSFRRSDASVGNDSNVGAYSITGPGLSDELEVGIDDGTADIEGGSVDGIITVDSADVRSTDGEPMLNAMLVDDDALVEASKAPEGFKALVHNKRFKHMVAAIVLILLAVIIPVAILVPGSGGNDPVVLVNTTAIECGTSRTNQADYRGTISKTEAGETCQPWASQFPNSHDFKPEDYPDADLSENYCRNPDGDIRPWCFVNETGRSQRNYCRVPFCDSQINGVNNYICGTLKEVRQADYRGIINQTMSGKTCQRWDSQEPHVHPNTPERTPLAGLEANYCRNPDGEGAAWCYTTDNNTRWEHCNVPLCEVLYFNDTTAAESEADTEETVENSIETCGTAALSQADYRGLINVTETGRTCQRWDTQEPHVHERTREDYPESGLDDNYCRNPDGEPRAWCYTTDPEKRWEFCPVPDCPGYDLEQCGTYDQKQEDYTGTINVTRSGLACQPWAQQSPHFHYELPALMPDANLVSNYCRNPTGDERAWCYTNSSDVIWEYCDVPFCTSEEERQKSFVCGSRSKQQSDYRGTIAVTESGRRCQRWDTDFPHNTRGNAPESSQITLQENYCRNPDGQPRVWCLTTDINVRYEYCDVPFCEDMEEEEEVVTSLQCGSQNQLQADYRGDVNVTIGGIPCQAWTAQEPHQHDRTPEGYPQAGLSGNSCRNPDGEPRAWCYTTDPEKRWDFCSVPNCEDCGSSEQQQADYRGDINVTISGIPCQAWTAQEPHQHDRTPDGYPEAGLSGNSCRNPDGEPQAWCYTTDPEKRWEFCSVPNCGEIEEDAEEMEGESLTEELCSNCTVDECGSPEQQQADYRGAINVTMSGIPCQAWTAQEPHQHELTPEGHPEADLSGNSCRNPDGEPRAWCYTTDQEKRWEFCSVPFCGNTENDEEEEEGEDTLVEFCSNCTVHECGSLEQQQADYRGDINVTTSGIPCQAWTSQEPHQHSLTPDGHPEADLSGNSCRNPDGEPRAWCYTTDPERSFVLFHSVGAMRMMKKKRKKRIPLLNSAPTVL